jgi:hypothetical protein
MTGPGFVVNERRMIWLLNGKTIANALATTTTITSCVGELPSPLAIRTSTTTTATKTSHPVRSANHVHERELVALLEIFYHSKSL